VLHFHIAKEFYLESTKNISWHFFAEAQKNKKKLLYCVSCMKNETYFMWTNYFLFEKKVIHLHWYVLRTLPGQEEKNFLMLQHLFDDIKFIFPKRRLSWCKKGEVLDIIKPLFYGYFFASTSYKRIIELDAWLRTQKLDSWFVKIDKIIIPITAGEVQIIMQLMCNGDVIGESDILRVGDNVKIVEGPLVGMEGMIEKYSRKNRRVTLKVILGGKEKRVELEGKWINSNQKY